MTELAAIPDKSHRTTDPLTKRREKRREITCYPCGKGRSLRVAFPETVLSMKAKSLPKRSGLLAGGNWIVDHVKLIDRLPQPECLANIRAMHQGLGGAPCNVLHDLAQGGAPFPLFAAGLVGKDAAGTAIIADCKRHKIDTRHLGSTPKAATSFTDVMTEENSGRRTFFHSRGANALWTGGDLNFAALKVKHFHLGYLLLLDALDAGDTKFETKAAKLLASAVEAGVKTSVDVVSEEGDRLARIVRPSLKFTDYLIVNEFEAGKISGFKVREPDGKLDTVTLRHAAGALLQQGVRELVVLHFPEGAFARTRKGDDCWQSSVKLPQKMIAGMAGAGDAFCAGFLLGIHEGWETKRCLETGVCVAAACLTDSTCTCGVKSLSTSLALGKKYKFHPPLEAEE
jgi:sugar/nucleoside kinase (ribokinase family)